VTCACCGAPGAEQRAVSGVLGVVHGEVWRERTNQRGTRSPVAAALLDLARGYMADPGTGPPLDAARRHEGVPGPAWLLCVAIVHDDIRRLASDTLELAVAAEVPRVALGDCVDYVFLAAALFTGCDVDRAIEAATSAPGPSPGTSPSLCGETIADALTASVWALTQTRSDVEVLDALADETTPGVTAAVGGVLGLRRGSALLQHGRPRRGHVRKYAALVPALLNVRHGLNPDLVRAGMQGDLTSTPAWQDRALVERLVAVAGPGERG
jgi:hypothetical protein